MGDFARDKAHRLYCVDENMFATHYKIFPVLLVQFPHGTGKQLRLSGHVRHDLRGHLRTYTPLFIFEHGSYSN